MIPSTLWEQHRLTFKVAGCELRYLRFVDHAKATAKAGISAEDLAFIQRLGVKKTVDAAAITPAELAREEELMRRFPLLDTWAACFVSPRLEDGDHLKHWLYSLPEDDRTTLKLWLQELADPGLVGTYGAEYLPVIGACGLPIAKDLDFTVITLQQALLLMGQTAAALQQQQAAAAARGA
jgi:hypothetical protein